MIDAGFRGRRGAAALLCILLAFAGCSAPVTVERVDLHTAYETLNRSALSGGDLSEDTRIVLRRAGLLDGYQRSPDATIAALRALAISRGMEWPDLFALSELSYARGRETGARAQFLAAVLYAYAVLFPDSQEDRPSPYAPEFLQAVNLYNLGLTQVLTTQAGEVRLASGRFDLPFGSLDLTVDADSMRVDGRDLVSFVPTMNLQVKGFQNNYRNSGIGAPMAASLTPRIEPRYGLFLPPHLRVPTSAVLQLRQPRRQLAGSSLTGTLTVHTIFDGLGIRIAGQDVPLEFDQTAVRALFLTEGQAWSNEISGLFNSDRIAGDHLGAIEPHRYGRIPVVLVHGTASSPFRWADMVNDLLEDRRIRDRYEFWFFSYSTGNPIPYSALLLREALQGAVQNLGGVQADPALGRMVVIGHSQGGLLAKMLVIEPGTKLFDALSSRPLDELKVSPDTRELLRRALFFHPLPFVRQAIFIATPHRGSYLADFSLAQFVARFITLPLSMLSATGELLAGNRDALRVNPVGGRFTSFNGMAPSSPSIRALASIPIVPTVHAHSIIPTLGDGPLETRDDGVVEYSSAHIDGVDSELVVRGGHSAQGNPATIAEVRRILLEQLAQPGPKLRPVALAN
jgi:pimeloyl-ACP methyl ester carboxylesterase